MGWEKRKFPGHNVDITIDADEDARRQEWQTTSVDYVSIDTYTPRPMTLRWSPAWQEHHNLYIGRLQDGQTIYARVQTEGTR